MKLFQEKDTDATNARKDSTGMTLPGLAYHAKQLFQIALNADQKMALPSALSVE